MEDCVCSPAIPYAGSIPQQAFVPNKIIRLQGRVPNTAQRFEINLQCGLRITSPIDIAVQVSVSFLDGYITLNSLQNGKWGEERQGILLIQCSEHFEIVLSCDYNWYKVAINGEHYCDFPQRINYSRITHLMVDGDVSISCISYETSRAETASAPRLLLSRAEAASARRLLLSRAEVASAPRLLLSRAEAASAPRLLLSRAEAASAPPLLLSQNENTDFEVMNSSNVPLLRNQPLTTQPESPPPSYDIAVSGQPPYPTSTAPGAPGVAPLLAGGAFDLPYPSTSRSSFSPAPPGIHVPPPEARNYQPLTNNTVPLNSPLSRLEPVEDSVTSSVKVCIYLMLAAILALIIIVVKFI